MKQIKLTNPDKLIFPKDNIRKADLAEYYFSVSELMLPLVKNRLLSVIRCHNGINGECFINKHPNVNKFVETAKYNGGDYFYIKNKTQLIYQVQMGTVEFHAQSFRIEKPFSPDVMTFDLDPDAALPLKKLRDAVKRIKSLLDELKLKSFLKTSGGKGYHVTVPFRSANADKFYGFSEQIATLATARWEADFTTNIRKSRRKGKIFVDYLRNGPGATCVCPYSVRARDGAPLSFPIPWEELDKISPNEITLLNYKKYLNDSWKDFLTIKQRLK